SLRFVVEEMFPFVRKHLAEFIVAKKNDAAVLQACDLIRQEASHAGFKNPSLNDPISELCAAVNYLMDRDAKTTGLKELQGMIWQSGFQSGNLIAHVYDEVPNCLQDWKSKGCDLRIYSSGSIAAQRLFFGHTKYGNLLPLFSAHYDTVIGGKKEAVSYTRIVADCGVSPGDVLFVSDIVEELVAASSAGLQTLLSLRPENHPQPANPFPAIRSFTEIQIA
ncbi:MAG: acireductone synthase, partial [Pirellulaceae bacterium]